MRGLYVGRTVAPDTLTPRDDDYALLDADALVRHAVCIGMTGSGKTGLCVAVLEELAMAGVPLVLVDPKGDLANLALAFRSHEPADFRPWVDEAEARRAGRSPDAHAEALSAAWRAGLEAWQVRPERVAAFVDGARVTVYTPGSTAGVPVDVLGSLARPPAGDTDDEALAELSLGSAAALLGLVGHAGDAATDPPVIVVARVLHEAWRAGVALDSATLIAHIADPPFAKVGVFPVDTVWPRAERVRIAVALDAFFASPSAAAWSRGAPLDPDALFATGPRTPVSVFSLAHLDEPQRQFVVALLLERIVAWARRQPGTSALRALVYFDEVWGYLPPHPKQPPAKRPVLALMKQARAVGVGVMLATQNPVDVDYAALANAGTWLVGRLQTRQDREKVVHGLAAAGGALDRDVVDGWLAALPPRTFVWRDAGAPAPTLLMSRHTISWLRGPLTRAEIRRLSPEPEPPPAPAPVAAAPPPGATLAPPPPPDGFSYRFLDPEAAHGARLVAYVRPGPRRDDGAIVWAPALYARLRLSFAARDLALDRDEHRFVFPLDAGVATEPALTDDDLRPSPPPGPAYWLPLPADLDEARELRAAEKRIVEEVLRGEVERTFRHRGLGLQARAGEDEAAFRARVLAAADDRADAEIAKLRDRVARDVQRLEDRRERLIRDRDRRALDAQSRQTDEIVHAGTSLLGLFFGRRRVASAVSGAVGKRRRTAAAEQRASELDQEIAALENDVFDLESRIEAEIAEIRERWRRDAADIEVLPVKLARSGIAVDRFTLVWVPVTRRM